MLLVSQIFLNLAQIPLETTPEAAEDAALVFSGPQFFTALIAGVVLAFAFQLLFTNLGIATGISLAGGGSSSSDSGSFGSTIRTIGITLGLGTLISVTIALFLACTFAVKLSLFVSPTSGAIVGLVIWATYFSLLVFVSSTTIGSLIGSVVNTATSSFQALFGTATAVIGGKAASQQVVATAEAAAAAVRRELGSAIDPVTLRENVQDYLDSLRPPQLDVERIATDFEQLLDDENLQAIVNSDSIGNIDSQTFVELVSDRSDLSKQDVNRIADKLESVWRKSVGNLPKSQDPLSQFVDYLKQGTREQLVGSDFSDKLDKLIEEMRQRRQNATQGQQPVSQALTVGFNSLVGLVMGRTDLSDFDVESIVDQLQQLKEHLGEQGDKLAAQVGVKEPKPQGNVYADIESYLLNAYAWQLKQQNLDREFRNLLYDPAADPEAVARELEQINRSDFVDLLQQKGIFTQAKIEHTANLLEAIRLEVLATAQAAREREAAISLLAQVEDYLLSTPKTDLTPEKIQLELKPILQDSDADYEQLSNRLAQFDRPTWERILERRGDLNGVEISVFTNELEIVRDRVLKEAQETLGAAKAKAQAQWLKLQSYLRDTGKNELNPQAIERELRLLLNDPQAGAAALKARVARFDRNTLVQLLTQRNDLSEEQVNEAIDTVERSWTRLRYAPQKLEGKVMEQYNQAKSALTDYLRGTGKTELSPRGIQQDLTLLLDDPQLGAKAIRQRLAAMDRDTLVQLLAQRDDLSERQVNQIIDDVQTTLRSLAKAPRRIAQRTQEKVQDFQSSVADYLRSTEKEELNPQGIKRDVELLLSDPRTGMESLKERLSKFDRDTLVALLSERDDLSAEEINSVIDQILAVRDQAVQQLKAIQNQVQSVIDRLLAKIRSYLNSLERPELNYQGVKRDINTLFDDPEAGFEALKDRFSQMDRDTLVALLSSREDISKMDAERLISQVERTRDRVLQKAERLQTETQLRLEEFKLEAQRQAEETRKAAAVASWWLFFTALISAIASAGAGALGVVD